MVLLYLQKISMINNKVVSNMKCPSCGNENYSYTTSCFYCGADLTYDPAGKVVPQPTTPPQREVPTVTNAQPEPVYRQPEIVSGSYHQPVKSSHGFLFYQTKKPRMPVILKVIAVISIIILTSFGFFGMYFSTSRGEIVIEVTGKYWGHSENTKVLSLNVTITNEKNFQIYLDGFDFTVESFDGRTFSYHSWHIENNKLDPDQTEYLKFNFNIQGVENLNSITKFIYDTHQSHGNSHFHIEVSI